MQRHGAVTGSALTGCFALAAAMAACVAVKPAAPLSPCDVITGTATNFGRAATLRRAEAHFRVQAPIIRGELVGSGVSRVRVVNQRSSCQPYQLLGASTGLVTCKVQARICGR